MVCFQSLRGKTLTKVVRALKKEYKGDPGMDWKRYISVHFDKFIRVIISNGFRYVFSFRFEANLMRLFIAG